MREIFYSNKPVSRAVHRLQCKSLLLSLEREHVIAVVLPVAGRLPHLAVVDIGGDNFLETSLLILDLNLDQH